MSCCCWLSTVVIIVISAGVFSIYFIFPSDITIFITVGIDAIGVFFYLFFKSTPTIANNESSDLNNPVQVENPDAVTSLESVQVDASRPEENQTTCPSYNELYELNKPPPTYEQCYEANVISSASQRLNGSDFIVGAALNETVATNAPKRAQRKRRAPEPPPCLAMKDNIENQTCQVDGNSIPEETGMSETAACSDAIEPVPEPSQMEPSQNI